MRLLFTERSWNERSEVESPERNVDDAVCPENDGKPDNAPEDSVLTLFALPLVSRMRDELEHAPNEHDKRARREKQNYRIDNLYDDLPEKFIEFN